MKDFNAELQKLAEHLAETAILKDTPFAESIDAFKELRSYYALLAKEKPESDESDKGSSIRGFQRRLKAVEEGDGSGSVSGRKRSS